MTETVLWFRRDLRRSDLPSLQAALQEAAGGQIVPLFVLDDRLRQPSGAPRLAFLYRCLRVLDEDLGGRLCVRSGEPEVVVPQVVREVGANAVHVTADLGPYGRERDRRVAAALEADGRQLIGTGTPYAVAPGEVRQADGSAYRVFSPYFRAWQTVDQPPPASVADDVAWGDLVGSGIPDDPDVEAALPPAGEQAALDRLQAFLSGVGAYAEARDFPGADSTSRLSPYLKYGCIHPRTVLAQLGGGEGERKLIGELAWRDFYADVLFHRPDAAREDLTPALARMDYDAGPAADERFIAWAEGRTGYPIVDAGMRQLRQEAWIHNRVRMTVASFLVKDLHLPWQRGAREFLRHLVDGDLASNNQGWQWVAGTGTDPAPYFRIFNPVRQSKRFDPDGTYIRRYVPELAGVEGDLVHEPWRVPGGPPNGYPRPIVDHAAERKEALRRYQSARD